MSFPDITPALRAAAPDLRGRLLANAEMAPLTLLSEGSDWAEASAGGSSAAATTKASRDGLGDMRMDVS